MKSFRSVRLFFVMMCFSVANSVLAYCSLDHLFIGCNQDGISGTDDDDVLFIDSRHKYRNAGGQWHYTLIQSGFHPENWVLNVPGFDEIHDPGELPADHPVKDAARSPQGDRGVDYELWVECIAISDNFKVHNLNESILLNEPGDVFNHSYYSASDYGHLHLYYTYTNASSSDPAPAGPLWFIFRIYDAKGVYQPSDYYTVVFMSDPLAGDLVIDNHVDLQDFAHLAQFWLEEDGSTVNDYYERADSDQSGTVDIEDLAEMIQNWLDSIP